MLSKDQKDSVSSSKRNNKNFMIKTNKSYAKRLKVTRTGKILSRKPGQNHFNAKERTRASLSKRRMSVITNMKNKAKSRVLVNL